MKEYCDISKIEFELGLIEIVKSLPKIQLQSLKPISESGTKEYVYVINTHRKDIQLKIYSSISCISGYSRKSGVDAIRCVAIYKNSYVFNNTSHTKRLVNWKTNLKNKIIELLSDIDEIPTCTKCNSVMIQRKGKYGLFWGCSNYPKCKEIVKV